MTELVDPTAILIVVIALVIIAGGVMRAWKPVRKVFRWLDTLIGDPEDRKNPGILARMDAFERTLGEVHTQVAVAHRELVTNHGSSLKDVVMRIEDRQKIDHGRLTRLEEVAETVEELHDLIDPDD